MDGVKLTAESRTNTGKGAARSLRRAGKVPAVIYGHSHEPQSLSVELVAVAKLLDVIGGETVLIDVAIDNKAPVKAIVREVQRNPVRRSDVIHLDLYAIVAGESIVVDVPIHLTGNPEGVRNQGGVVDHHLHRISVRCLPADIPESIVVDITALSVGQAIHVGDLPAFKGEYQLEADVSVVSVLQARVEVEPTEVTDDAPEVIKKGKADEDEETAGE